MKLHFLCLLLCVSVLLITGLTVVTVSYYIPPYPPSRALIHLLTLVPFFICTWRMLSLVLKMKAGLTPADSMEMSQFVEHFPGFDEDHETTTEQVF